MPGPDNDLSNRQLRLLWALLVGFVVVCHWDWLVLGEPIKGADISTYYTPFFEEYLRQFAKGRFPLWTNTVFSGHPIVGEGQVTLLHPLMHVLLRVCGRHAAAIWLVTHALFGALGIWYYCRALGASRFASVLAALAMALNGFFAVRVIQPNYYATLAYLPWQLLLVDKLCARRAPLYWAVPLAVVTGLQWLCGHPQIPIFSNYLLGFYTLLRLLGRVGATEETRANWIALPKIAGALMAGLALASIQLLPLVMDVVRAQSERSAGISLAFSTFGSLPPWGVLLPLLPGIYGPEGGNAEVPYWLALSGGKVASWETHIYIGAALLLLAVLALWRLRAKEHTRLLGFFVLLCILFALGKFSPVFWALHYLPGLNLLRVPSRAMGPLLIFLLPLAALGLDWLARASEEDKRSWNRLLRGALALCIGFWIVLGVGTRTVGPQVLEKAIEISTAVEQKKLDARGDIHPATKERRLNYATDRPTHALGQIEHATGLNPLLLSNLGFLALVGLLIGVWARASDHIRFARLSVALFILCGAELVWFNREFGIHGSDVETPFARPVYAEKVGDGKFFSAISPREVLGGDWNLLRHRAPALASIIWDLPSPDGRTSMQPSEYMSIILPLRGFDRAGKERLELIGEAVPKLRLLGTSAVLTLSRWGKLDLPVLYRDADVTLWQIPAPSARAFVLGSDEVTDQKAWQEALGQERPDAAARERFRAALEERAGTVAFDGDDNPDAETMSVDSPTGGWLVRIVRNMPGWRAFVGGKEVPITGALGFFQGVPIPAGRSQVEFRYEPPSFYWGSRISAGAALALLVLLGLSLYRARRQNP